MGWKPQNEGGMGACVHVCVCADAVALAYLEHNHCLFIKDEPSQLTRKDGNKKTR